MTYLSEYENEAKQLSISAPQSRFFILGGLKAYTTYSIKIAAINNQYKSNFSQLATAKTIESGML